jgi:hypothetical protein
MSTFATDDRDSRVLADMEALGGTFGDPKMTPRPRPLPPVPPMAPVGPRHVSGTGRPGDPFVFEDETPLPASEWAARRRLDDEERRRRGVERAKAAEQAYRDHRDAADEDRRR